MCDARDSCSISVCESGFYISGLTYANSDPTVFLHWLRWNGSKMDATSIRRLRVASVRWYGASRTVHGPVEEGVISPALLTMTVALTAETTP